MAVIKMNFLSQCLGMQANVTVCLPSFSFADIMSGRKDVYVGENEWAVITKDGKLSAHYENSVLITPESPYLLTLPQ